GRLSPGREVFSGKGRVLYPPYRRAPVRRRRRRFWPSWSRPKAHQRQRRSNKGEKHGNETELREGSTGGLQSHAAPARIFNALRAGAVATRPRVSARVAD